MIRITLFVSVFMIYSCKSNSTKHQIHLNQKQSSTLGTNEEPALTYIDIQPFAGLPKDEALYLYNELKKIYPNVILSKSINLPHFAFYIPRNRFKADSLIHFLSARTQHNHITIGLTNKDISSTKGQIPDWGIMGLGLEPGNACVVSTFRLSKSQLLDQLFKVSVHELGHTEGLPHCHVKTCFMRDAEGKNTTNEETEFCASCKWYLDKRGWRL